MGSAAEVPVVISSDEEDGAQKPATGKRKSPDDDALAWVEGILDQEDPDDAVLEGVLGYPAMIQEILDSLKAETGIVVGEEGVVGAKNTSTVSIARGDDDDDDDDCVMLDGDPEKPVAIAKEEWGPSRDAAADELQIVAEKGEIACRDFPHPRHLCATLPFDTSSHASHCSMCHCYVCDCRAPCTFWVHHCHATDKDSKWKKLRQSKNKSQPTPKRRLPQHFNPSVTTGPSSQYSMNVTGFSGRFPAPSPMPSSIPSYGSQGSQVAPPTCTSSNGNHLQPSVPSYGLVQPARPHASQPAQVSLVGHVSSETFQSYRPQFPVGAPMGPKGHQYRPPSYPHLAPNTVVGTGVPLTRYSSLNALAQGAPRPQVPSPGIMSKESLTLLARQLGLPDYNTNQRLRPPSTSTPQYKPMHPRDILLAQGAQKDRRQAYVKKSFVAATSQIRASSRHNSSNHAPGGTVISSGSVQIQQPLPQLKPGTVVSSGSAQIQQPLCQLKPGTVLSSGSSSDPAAFVPIEISEQCYSEQHGSKYSLPS